jgi:patatin-like phospholipase/acyl hydrolase
MKRILSIDGGGIKGVVPAAFLAQLEEALGESRTRLVIPSLNLETGEVHVYKTAHHPRFEVEYKERAVEVALATAAAPTYFPTHRSAKGIPFIDVLAQMNVEHKGSEITFAPTLLS